MSSLEKGNQIVFEKSESLVEYRLNNKPKIVISTGTGVAPHISFLNELIFAKKIEDNSKLVVLHGCRNFNKDFVCEKEMKIYETFGKVFVAFSRDQIDKKYVQHFLEENPKDFFSEFIQNNLKDFEVYVCGNSKFLPKSIQRLIQKSSGNYLEKSPGI